MYASPSTESPIIARKRRSSQIPGRPCVLALCVISNSRRPGNLGIAIPPLARGRKLCRRRHWVPILELLLGCTQVLAVFTIWVGAIRRIGFRLTRGRSGLRRHCIFPCEGLKSRDTDALWGG